MSWVTSTTVFCTRCLDAPELAVHLAPGDRVERAERFVHQENRRIGGEGPGHTHSLTLSTRQLVRPALRVVGGIQPDQVEQFVHSRVDTARVPPQ